MVRAHLGPLKDQPLTIYFVGGFFFGASLAPGFNPEQVRLHMVLIDFFDIVL
jgi:hypothetical protein